MELQFIEDHENIKGLKSKDFISQLIINNTTERDPCFWVSPLMINDGGCAGWFCTFSDDNCEYHLRNNKGAVRVFSTIEAALVFYRKITFSDGSCITSVLVGVVN